MCLTTMISVLLLGVVLVAHADEPNPLAGLGLVGSRTNSTLAAPPPASFRTRDSTTFGTRAAIPARLKAVELSCLNLAANCIDSVNSETKNNLWGIVPCVAVSTCYGVGSLITSVECQTGFSITNSAQVSLDYLVHNLSSDLTGN
ncbi:hypothetical protein DFH08DRAFT_813168 [Mycena albidolilacea]|uniref:Hydrophobin n=1 Tax=Mycena albidolilacea TaxID=1033008 RepID=A0AAD7EN14_9AGAR|nr:hypothetical protein DFH08DRAFT_813168 [Mycena albidolilacea]